MRKLKPNQPITIVSLERTWRARTLRGGKGRVYFKIVRGEEGQPYSEYKMGGVYRGHVLASEEGEIWARGWNTEEANALKVAWDGLS